MQLLNYAEFDELPEEYTEEEQKEMLKPLERLLEESGLEMPRTVVIPALLRKPEDTSRILYLNPYDLTDWLPNSFVKAQELFC